MPGPATELLPPRIQLTAVVVSVAMLLVTLELIRKNRLREDYALLWLGGGLVMLACALWPGLIRVLAALTGAIYPPSAIFIAALLTLTWLLLHFSVIISTLTARLVRLSQRVAWLEMRLGELAGAAAQEE
jgi:hypothetical protein